MTTLTETSHAGGFLISEAEGTRARDSVTVLSGQDLAAGHVVGRVKLGAATVVKTGTGNGTLTLDATTPILDGAKVGAYVATCITAATNGGTFRVEDPDGYVLGNVDVGSTFADDLKFVIADGSTDFIVGDFFTITVAAGSGKVKEWNPANLDGSQVAAGVLYSAVNASAADKPGVIISRSAEVHGTELFYFTGATSGNKTTAATQLAALGIIVR